MKGQNGNWKNPHDTVNLIQQWRPIMKQKSFQKNKIAFILFNLAANSLHASDLGMECRELAPIYSYKSRPIKTTKNEDQFFTNPNSLNNNETVFSDDRRNIIFNTSEWPYSCHTKLDLIFKKGAPRGGSGIMVGPSHILTAGHNIYDHENPYGWVKKVTVHAGLAGGRYPFEEAHVTRAYSFSNWLKKADINYDIALLVLDLPLGERTGWAGMTAYEYDTLPKNIEVSITGYPGDKGGKHMWGMEGVFDKVETERFFYRISTYRGQSGSGICQKLDEGPSVLGIHTQGTFDRMNGRNSGVRLTYPKIKAIINRISESYSPYKHTKGLQGTPRKHMKPGKTYPEKRVRLYKGKKRRS